MMINMLESLSASQQNEDVPLSSTSRDYMGVFCFLIMTGPTTLAVLYALSVWIFLASWGEISWSSKASSLFLRLALWGGSLAITWGCILIPSTSGSATTMSSLLWIKILPISIILFVISCYLIYQTRVVDINGPIPSALLELWQKKSKSSTSCCHACQNNLSSASSTSTSSSSLLLHDKVVIVTGANTGIGKETCFQLALLGATVIMACRNVDKARMAQEDLQQRLQKHQQQYCCNCQAKSKKNNNNDENENHFSSSFLILPLDLSNLASVRRAVHVLVHDLIKSQSFRLCQIHALVNNAGVMHAQKVMTEPDGYEMCFQANHLGHYLFTRLLIEAVEQEDEDQKETTATVGENTITTTSPVNENDSNEHKLHPTTKKAAFRILNLSSITYKMARAVNPATGQLECRLALDDLNCNIHRTYTLFGQYGQTKLCNLLFTQELVRRGYISYAINPGLVRTDVTRNMPWWLYYPDRVASLILKSLQKTPSQGAYTSTWATTVGMTIQRDQQENATTTTTTVITTDSSLLPPNGSFLADSAVIETNAYVTHYAGEDAKQLWTLSEEMVHWR